uniref:Uncharacterized protein n=1 Tax=Glossina austeni TaxID=7395 RepID=A0A1A9UGF1_GLOAU
MEFGKFCTHKQRKKQLFEFVFLGNCVGGRKSKITKRIILEYAVIGAGPISTPLISKVDVHVLLSVGNSYQLTAVILLFNCGIDIVRITEKILPSGIDVKLSNNT